MDEALGDYLSTLAMTPDLSGLNRPNGISNLASFDHFFIVVMGTGPYPDLASRASFTYSLNTSGRA